MGWGDRGFYLETPTWSDLKFSTAFNAVFYRGSTAMHVSFYGRLRQSAACRKIHISKESYRRIVDYVSASFKLNDKGELQLIPQKLYGSNDIFYEAQGHYGMFHTCNTWVNNCLKAGNQRACVWTPFDKGIYFQYRE
jgi:uncharacterized protein (TIGR02117 family)